MCIAQNESDVKLIKTLLENQDILVRIRRVDLKSETSNCYDVLVPKAEVEKAHTIIIEEGF